MRTVKPLFTCGLIIVISIFGLVACGGEEIPPPVFAESADIDKTLASDAWEVTLISLPSQDRIIGDEEAGGNIQMISQYEQGVREAKGTWLVAPIRLTNLGDEENMLFKATIKVVDDQGNEYESSDRLVHFVQIWIADPDQWGDQDNQLVQNVLRSKVTREGPLIFDVAEDATGLKMILTGAEGEINLGF